jgi:hypothetical protein
VHQLEAAQSCLVIADNAMAPEEMDQAYACVRHLLNDEGQPFLSRLWIRAIYGSSRGELDDGIRASRELISHYRRSGNIWELIKMLHNSTIPLRYAGCFEEAHRNLQEAINLAQERNLWRSYIELLDTSATLYLHQDRYNEAWRSQAAAVAKFPEALHSTATVGSIIRLGAQIAIAEGDISLARSLYEPTPEHLADSTRLFRDDSIATEIVISAKIGEPVDSQLLDCLLRSHQTAKESGRRDFMTAALVLGLRTLGREDEGRSILAAYVTRFRRERYPIPGFLARITGLRDVL